MRKESGGLTNIGKMITKAFLRKRHEPRTSEEKLLKVFSYRGSASAEILVKKRSSGVQGKERESLWLQLFKIREGKVIDEVEERK